MNTSELVLALADGSLDVIERRKRWIEEIEYPQRVFGRSHREEYIATLERSRVLLDFFKNHGIGDVNDQEAISEALGIVLPLDMHRKMFVPALQLSMSPEQWIKWKDVACSYQILGAYAQTELGHGSNVRGIETTAVYDKDCKSFDLHSPTITSRKWWPGGLGKTANFAVVYARLLVDNVDYGLHAFLVQLRDLKTHQTLPGIELGDIGTKIGFNGVDNGYCTFNHVSLPKQSLLMGSARVEWVDDNLVPKKSKDSNAKWGYFTMVKTRVFIVSKCARFLARALTLTLPSICLPARRALYPSIGLAIASTLAGKKLYELYQMVLKERNTAALQRLHALSSGLKAYVSDRVVDSIAKCRRVANINDPSHALVHLQNEIVGTCTYEGTFDILVLQHASYLMKHKRQEPTREVWSLNCRTSILKLFEARCNYIKPSSDYAKAKLSIAASELYLLQEFDRSIDIIQDGETANALRRLWFLLAYYLMLQRLSEFQVPMLLNTQISDQLITAFEDTAFSLDEYALDIVGAYTFTAKELAALHASKL